MSHDAADLVDSRPASLAEAMGEVSPDEQGTSLWKGAFQRLVRSPWSAAPGRSSEP